jgi:hypothetical protein
VNICRRSALVIGACLSVLLLCPAVAQNRAPSIDVAIVVNPKNPVTNVSSSELRNIFRGEVQHWKSNIPIQILIRAPQAKERVVVLRELLGLSEAEYKQYWISKVYRGEVVSPPVEVHSNAFAAQGVRALPGAIACMKMRDVPPSVKVLRIDGLLPGDKGYPLHID